jgi:hypothetical protein
MLLRFICMVCLICVVLFVDMDVCSTFCDSGVKIIDLILLDHDIRVYMHNEMSLTVQSK